jgi:hypothetical protein
MSYTIRTVTTISNGGRRRILRPCYLRHEGAWCLQWGNPTKHGHRFEDPLPVRYRTRKEAMAAAKRIRNGEQP